MDSFNENQKNAFEAMINGNNIFITGPGGSGKSHVINYFGKMFMSCSFSCFIIISQNIT